jgi:hypothetical protein
LNPTLFNKNPNLFIQGLKKDFGPVWNTIVLHFFFLYKKKKIKLLSLHYQTTFFTFFSQKIQKSFHLYIEENISNWFRNDKELLKNMSCSSRVLVLYIELAYKRKACPVWHAIL